MTAKQLASDDARRLLQSCYDGVLSTHSRDLPGYPFGSVVPYCLDRSGAPIILIASIAQHTKNILADPHTSLIVFDRSADDLQSNGRLTLLADAALVAPDDADTSARYYRYFPEARDYHLTHDFAFCRLAPQRIRFIGGFGQIFWLEPQDVLLTNPFTDADERRMIEHMNADHAAAMHHYCRLARVPVADGDSPLMAGVDAEGCHLRVGGRVVRIPFLRRVSSAAEVRGAMVELARAPVPPAAS